MRARRGGDERGFSLAELLVTIAILGVAVVVILGAVSGALSSGSLHRELTLADVWGRRYAEQLEQRNYRNCATQGNYAAALRPAPPSGLRVRWVSIEYWNGDEPATFTTDRNACRRARDNGIQRVRFVVERTTGPRAVAETFVVVKRSRT